VDAGLPTIGSANRTLTSAGVTGLSSPEASRRRTSAGFNEVLEPKVSFARRILSYFWGPIPAMIEVALILSALLRNWDDFAIILTLLLVNAAVGFWEEYQAGNAVAALKAHLAPQARVLRDGAWTTIPARELVPGDAIRLRMGDIVPADVRLLEDTPLELDQSALTGESLPVSREAGGSALSGSIVRRGENTAEVVAIGSKTFLGKTTQLVAQAHPVSHLQRAILRIGDTLIVIALSLAIVVEAVSLLRGVSPLSSIEFVLVLVIAAIPVAMPTVLSVTLAVGARNLASEKTIVSHLESVEELAGMDVLCSDKTGTLTQNRLRMGDPLPLPGAVPREVLEAGILSSRPEDHDPIDDAILATPGASGIAPGYRAIRFEPFDPVRKRTEATVQRPDGRTVRVSKGAPQAILALVGGTTEVAGALDAIVSECARRGFRALGVARADGDGPWRYLGVIPLFDPLRPDSLEVVGAIRTVGVRVKMVTGDQEAIARETARQLGLDGIVCTPEQWKDTTNAPGRSQLFEEATVFAQVFPDDKYAIVEELQRRGHILGMTGDGVNDAPALKEADVGIGVSGATDAARAAADVVLTEPGLGVILTAIRQARQTFARMTSYATYRIAETIRLLFFITLSILLLGFFPVTPIQIVLIAILNDGSILTIAYDRAPVPDQPLRWRMPSVLRLAVALGLTGVVSSFILLAVSSQFLHISGGALQTLIYLKLSVAGQLTIFLTRTPGPFWRFRPAGILVAAVIAAQTTASLLAIGGWFFTPIPALWVVELWAYAVTWMLITDQVKQRVARWSDRKDAAEPPPLHPEEGPTHFPWQRFYHARHRATAPGSGAAVPSAGGAGRAAGTRPLTWRRTSGPYR
jgi:H+-transporting ATPase